MQDPVASFSTRKQLIFAIVIVLSLLLLSAEVVRRQSLAECSP